MGTTACVVSNVVFNFEAYKDFFQYSVTPWGQGESAVLFRDHHVVEMRHWWPQRGSSYSSGVVDADYSLSSPKTICAWLTVTSYER